MDHKQFQEWVSGIDWLTPEQKQLAQTVQPGEADWSVSLEAIEAKVSENRQCPRYGTPGALSRGRARGLWRY